MHCGGGLAMGAGAGAWLWPLVGALLDVRLASLLVAPQGAELLEDSAM